MFCVQPDKHWHCFEGDLPETESLGGARMGLFELHHETVS